MKARPSLISVRIRLGLFLWLLGLVGIVVVTVEDVPQLLQGHDLPIPLWVLMVGSALQSSFFLGLAVWAGVALAPQVAVGAPAFEAAVTSRSVIAALRPEILPGLIAGALGGGFL